MKNSYYDILLLLLLSLYRDEWTLTTFYKIYFKIKSSINKNKKKEEKKGVNIKNTLIQTRDKMQMLKEEETLYKNYISLKL